jgi:hypothetical protein
MNDVTRILSAVERGEGRASDPALVHEAFLRLVGDRDFPADPFARRTDGLSAGRSGLSEAAAGTGPDPAHREFPGRPIGEPGAIGRGLLGTSGEVSEARSRQTTDHRALSLSPDLWAVRL